MRFNGDHGISAVEFAGGAGSALPPAPAARHHHFRFVGKHNFARLRVHRLASGKLGILFAAVGIMNGDRRSDLPRIEDGDQEGRSEC